jgi:hypothetical protein
MVRTHGEKAWEGWLERATKVDAVKELRVFAEGLQKDAAAVRAALRQKWSNGQVEGQVNRLKVLSTDYPDRHSPSLGGYTTCAAMCDALRSYPQAAADGLVPDLPALLTSHPELTDILRDFFARSGSLPCFP